MYQHAALAVAIQANIPTIWWGKPGIGKTSIIRAIAKALEWPIETTIVSLSDPSEIGGMYSMTKDGLRRFPTVQAVRLSKHENGIYFFDELNTAAPANQAATLRIAQERVIGDEELPPGIRFVAASNEARDAAGGWDLTAPLSNRLWHYDGMDTVDQWAKGMVEGFPDPDIPILHPSWEDRIPQWRTKVASFVRAQQDLYVQMPKDDSTKGKAWPSPRSWRSVARLLAAGEGLGEDIQYDLAGGMVGPGPARQLINWVARMDLPNPEDLLRNYKLYKAPGEDDDHKVYAIMSSVTAAVLSNLNPDRWTKGAELIAYAAQWNKDVALGFMQTLVLTKNKMDPKPKTPKSAEKYVHEILKRMEMI